MENQATSGHGTISPEDLRIETWRPNRGGWCTQPDNCCRITHVPTGITAVVLGDENARSIFAAKAAAMTDLRKQLATYYALASSVKLTPVVDQVTALLKNHGASVSSAVSELVVKLVKDTLLSAEDLRSLEMAANIARIHGNPELYAKLKQISTQ